MGGRGSLLAAGNRQGSGDMDRRDATVSRAHARQCRRAACCLCGEIQGWSRSALNAREATQRGAIIARFSTLTSFICSGSRCERQGPPGPRPGSGVAGPGRGLSFRDGHCSAGVLFWPLHCALPPPGYDEDRNTWEPLEHLGDEIKQMARRFKQDAEAAGDRRGGGGGGRQLRTLGNSSSRSLLDTIY